MKTILLKKMFSRFAVAVVLSMFSHVVYAGAVLSNGTGGGTFTLTTTWALGVVPTSADTAVIVSGATVKLNIPSDTLAGLRIMPAAKFNNNGNLLTLYSYAATGPLNYIVYGEHDITGGVSVSV